MSSRFFRGVAATLAFVALGAQARAPHLSSPAPAAGAATCAAAPAAGKIEIGFSPEGSAERLVLKVIDSAQHTVRLAAYSFTSPPVVRALLAAKRRGVDVQAVVDYRGNRGKSSRAALNLLVNAGIPTKTISVYPIHHDKYIVADGCTVETGSFNYSRSAADRNSENVIVIWKEPEVAAAYLAHWRSRFDQGREYRSEY